MSKISIEDVVTILQKQNVAPQIVDTVVKEINEVIEEEQNSKVSLPKQKNEFLIVLSDPNSHVSSLSQDFTGWVVQMREGDDADQVLEKIKTAAKETNDAKKRKKNNIIQTMAEAFYSTKRYFLKPKNILIKTKEPVRVLITDGKL